MSDNPVLLQRLEEPISQVFKERPASIEEAGKAHCANMLAGCVENIICP
jgi:hypothetical protein